MPIVTLRPRTGVELIDASFQFLRENFALLFTAVVVAFVPVAVMGYVAAMNPGDVLLNFVARIADWVFSSAGQAAAIIIVAKRYLGEPITPADALRAVSARLATVLGVSFLYGLGVGFGLIFLIVPGIWVAVTYFAGMAAAMVEGTGANASLERSKALTKGSRLRIFGIFGVSYLVYFIATAFVGGIAGAVFGVAAGTLVATLLMACIYPFIAVLVTLLYFDLRIRREGLDLDLMLDPQAATVPAAG
ncbi:MAG: hypothetical protein HOQ11_10320 [Gemmatimonadaceae bacterium]|nr:hypothetical protein [Gemmatimonadaceae bacterium]NUQ92117.1 hypothetical protein [Gemmatimonadaceae bacterium]NUR18187.1 hypothetical protein [Gemmatimonadaceae bacterium]NUS97786.1 hypothetical protein [Gemmatimonadaceae bacterium]